jgi:phosphate transport system substrate-binding protein
MNTKALAVFFALLASPGVAQTCGGSFSTAGSATVQPISLSWKAGYQAQCPGVTVTVEGGGSSVGAARVCATGTSGSAVEIGNMSRDWKSTEATVAADGYTFTCVNNPARKVVQLDVALDGISVVAHTGGSAASCLSTLGSLSINQLRWIFGNLNETAIGLTLPNSDGNPATKKWSELNSACATVDVAIAGPDSTAGTNQFFAEKVFSAPGETYDAGRPYFSNADDQVLVNHLVATNNAVGFFGYAYYDANKASFTVTKINNILPTATTIADNSYLLSRTIYMNVLVSNSTSLCESYPFLVYGYSAAGTAEVTATGYVALDLAKRSAQLAQIVKPTCASTTPPKRGGCFSGLNTVEVKGKGIISMSALKIGDNVKVDSEHYSRVYSFGHFDRDNEAEYLQIFTKASHPLEVTDDHMIMKGNAAVRAGDVKVGDILSSGPVNKIETVKRQGTYAPATEAGKIAVSGVKASSYVSILNIEGTAQHYAYQAGLAPLRLLCKLDFSNCSSESYTNGISNQYFGLVRVINVLSKLPVCIQVATVAIAAPVLVLFYAVEQMILFPAVLIALVAGYLYIRAQTKKISKI